MGSLKPRSAVGRLPMDFASSSTRTPRNRDDFCADIDPMLRPASSPDVQWEAMQALTFMKNELGILDEDGVRDLVRYLGLDALKAEPAIPAPPASPSSVPCPQCPGRIGEPCISAKSGKPWNGYHTSRRRKANQEQQEKGAAA